MRKSKTFRDLLVELRGLTEEQLDCDLTIVDEHEEYFAIEVTVGKSDEDDVLDSDHPFLTVNKIN